LPQLFDTILANAGSRPADTNYSTAPRSGTNDIYSTHSASTNGSTTPTGHTRASPTPDHYNHCQSRSPIQPRSPGSTSAGAHVGRHPQQVPPRSLTSTDDIFGKHTLHQARRSVSVHEGREAEPVRERIVAMWQYGAASLYLGQPATSGVRSTLLARPRGLARNLGRGARNVEDHVIDAAVPMVLVAEAEFAHPGMLRPRTPRHAAGTTDRRAEANQIGSLDSRSNSPFTRRGDPLTSRQDADFSPRQVHKGLRPAGTENPLHNTGPLKSVSSNTSTYKQTELSHSHTPAGDASIQGTHQSQNLAGSQQSSQGRQSS
jgi:hypothetical protein